MYALKVDFLVPDLIKFQESITFENTACSDNSSSNAVFDVIEALSSQTDDAAGEKKPFSLEEESQNRVKSLLNAAKNGCLGAEEQSLMRKKSEKLQFLSKELFDTEKRYLETLRILTDIGHKVETTPLDHQEVLRDVFKEIPSLFMLHAYMDDKFYQSHWQTPVFAWWIEIFTSTDLAPFFNIYKTFLSRVRANYETLQAIYDKDKPFQQYCQSLVLSSQFSEQHIQTIPGMYIGIQSRLMRYQLLLQKIVVLSDGIDRERCECALKIIINILKSSEEEVTRNEMINQALVINSKLDGRRNYLDRLSLFIRSGPCLKIPRRSVGKKPLSRHLFLFSDYLIITEPETATTGRYLVKSELTIVSMIVEEPKLEDDIPVERCIRVRAVECVVELMFTDMEEKLSWWKSLEDTIEQERRRNNLVLSITPKRSISFNANGEEVPRAAEWVKDEQATMCALCYRHFTHIRRKHHCRACGKIFCGVCSHYKAVVDHLGPAEVRVCEVDFYRLHPNLKPKTAAALERIAQFSESGQRFAPYHCSFLMYTKKVRDQWVHKKTHMRVEYSSGLVPRERNTCPSASSSSSSSVPPSPSLTPTPGTPVASNSPSLFVSNPPRKMSLGFPCLNNTVLSLAAGAAAASSAPSTVLPLPAARLILSPQTSRVFCILQPDTLMAVYAAKEDARPCDSIILLGTRLLYLVRLGGNGSEAAAERSKTSAARRPPPSSSELAAEDQNKPGVNNHNSSEGQFPPQASTEDKLPKRRELPCPKSPRGGDPNACPPAARTKESKEESGVHQEVREGAGEAARDEAPNGEILASIPKFFSPISVDTLSVLSNLNSFLILPNNTDKVGHYFEAPSEEVRAMWIKKIKNCIVDFDST